MSAHRDLVPEVLPPRRPRGLLSAALAAAVGGAVGAGAVGVAAWQLLEDDTAPLTAAPAPAPVAAARPTVPAVDIDVELLEPPPAPLTGRAAFVVHAGGPAVGLAPAPAEWQHGTPTLVDYDDFSRTLKRATTDAVPASLRAVIGQRLIAIDERGERCEVIAGELSVVGTYYTEFDVPQTPPDRREAWDFVEPSLVAAIEVPDSCGELVWAVIPHDGADPGASLRTAAIDADTAMAPALTERFRSIDGYAAIQREYAEYHSDRWDDDATRLTALVGGPERGVAIASAASYPCQAGGQLSALWHVRDGALADRIAIPAEVVITEIVAAADLNNDGLPEILYRNDRLTSAVLVSDDGAYTRSDGPQILSHICPC